MADEADQRVGHDGYGVPQQIPRTSWRSHTHDEQPAVRRENTLDMVKRVVDVEEQSLHGGEVGVGQVLQWKHASVLSGVYCRVRSTG